MAQRVSCRKEEVGGQMNKLKVNQMLNDLKSANYCCYRIIELNEELEVLNHKMLGLSHNPIRLT